MKFFKGWKVVLSVSLASVLALTGCTPGTKESASKVKNDGNEKVELVLDTIAGPPATRLKSDAQAFEAANPNVKIKINEFQDSTYKEQAPRMFKSKEKPDVAWYWADRWYQTIVKSGALEPLDDLYVSENWNNVLPESTLKQYTSEDGHKYSVNIDVVWTPIMYYNKAAFEKAGVQPPKTFDDLYAIASKLKAAGYIPLVSGVGDGYVAGHIFNANLVRSVQPIHYDKLLDKTKKYNDIDYTSEDVLNAWKNMKRMADELMPKGVAGIKEDQARALFVQGKAAIYSNGSWAAGSGMLGKELSKDFKLGFFYYPQLRQDIQPKVNIYAGDALMVLKGTGKEEWAKKFVAFVMSADRQKELAAGQMFFPSRTDMTPEDLKPLGELFTGMYNEMNQMGTVPLWDGDIPGEMANLSFQLHQGVMAGSKTPEQAGKELETLFEKIIKDNQ